MNTDIPVLIVGAGPVGLALAAQLTDHGIPCRIIDQKPEPTHTSNAVAVHARTLELLANLGINNQMLAHGRKVYSGVVGSNKKTLLRWDLTKIPSPYPFVLCIPQSQTESILIDHLQQQGVCVERNCQFTDIQQNQDRATVSIHSEQGAQQINCQWVVACDGYHSAVRNTLHINYEQRDLELRFIMIDAPIETDQALDSLYMYFRKKITLMLFPMLHSVRMIAEVSHDARYRNIDQPDEKIFAALCSECLPFKVSIGEPLWASRFWVHEKLLDNYRYERVFFAGDAAHAHSPAGGQGMNTGIHDAINLAWKLALVIKQQAPITLLDSYQAERWPIAEQVIHMSHRLTRLATGRNPFMNLVRKRLVPLLAKKTSMQQKFVNDISEVSIHYRRSPIISGKANKNLKPGDRAPDAPLHYNGEKISLFALLTGKKHLLLDFSQEAQGYRLMRDKYHHLVHAIVVTPQDTDLRKTYGMSSNGLCLIRPDNYIGYLGQDVQELDKLLASYLVTQ